MLLARDQGATRVDERFLAFLASILGQETCSEWAQDPVNAADLQVLFDEWEVCKCAFCWWPARPGDPREPAIQPGVCSQRRGAGKAGGNRPH